MTIFGMMSGESRERESNWFKSTRRENNPLSPLVSQQNEETIKREPVRLVYSGYRLIAPIPQWVLLRRQVKSYENVSKCIKGSVQALGMHQSVFAVPSLLVMIAPNKMKVSKKKTKNQKEDWLYRKSVKRSSLINGFIPFLRSPFYRSSFVLFWRWTPSLIITFTDPTKFNFRFRNQSITIT
jgi:hypothetical protein